MDRCYYCKYGYSKHGGGKHDLACPMTKSDKAEQKKLVAKWDSGWKDGRGGKDEASDDPTYVLGHGEGIVALEEFENAHDPRFD